jgi:nucleoid DNA-binding protein
MKLEDLVNRISEKHGANKVLVKGFVLETFDELVAALERGEDVLLPRLGRFQWRNRKAANFRWRDSIYPECQRLTFKYARRLQRLRRNFMSEDDGMSKYGVALDTEKEKNATTKEGKSWTTRKPTVCPICMAALDSGGACPVHGTEPFEPHSAP